MAHRAGILAAAEYVEKRRCLPLHTPVRDGLEKNDCPGNDREHNQDRENSLIEWTGLENDLK